MDQCLIHVKDENLLMFWVPRLRQVDQLVLNELLIDHGQVVLNKVQCLQSMLEVLSVQVYFLTLASVATLRHLCDKLVQHIVSLLLLFIIIIVLDLILILILILHHLLLLVLVKHYLICIVSHLSIVYILLDDGQFSIVCILCFISTDVVLIILILLCNPVLLFFIGQHAL